jgi:hypothetical protein
MTGDGACGKVLGEIQRLDAGVSQARAWILPNFFKKKTLKNFNYGKGA